MRRIRSTLIVYGLILFCTTTVTEASYDIWKHMPIQVWTDLAYGLLPVLITIGAWLLIKSIDK